MDEPDEAALLGALLGIGRAPAGRAHRAKPPVTAPAHPGDMTISCSHAICGARFVSQVAAELHMQRHSVHLRCLADYCFNGAECSLCESYIKRRIITPERLTRLIQSPRIGEAIDVEARRLVGLPADDSRLTIEYRAGRAGGSLLGMDDRPLDIPVVADPTDQ